MAERKSVPRSAKRALQTVMILNRERRELDEITRHLERAQECPVVAPCAVCERLAHEVIAAMHTTRATLTERRRAETAGLIDDVYFLESNDQIEAAFKMRQQARIAYIEHRRAEHS